MENAGVMGQLWQELLLLLMCMALMPAKDLLQTVWSSLRR